MDGKTLLEGTLEKNFDFKRLATPDRGDEATSACPLENSWSLKATLSEKKTRLSIYLIYDDPRDGYRIACKITFHFEPNGQSLVRPGYAAKGYFDLTTSDRVTRELLALINEKLLSRGISFPQPEHVTNPDLRNNVESNWGKDAPPDLNYVEIAKAFVESCIEWIRAGGLKKKGLS